MMPFYLKNAPSKFYKRMDSVFSDKLQDVAIWYIDEILVLSVKNMILF